MENEAVNDEKFGGYVGQHGDKVGLEGAVLVEADVEQRAVGNEEQQSADEGDDGCGIDSGEQLVKGKAVHGAVNQQIDEHGVEKLFGQGGFKPLEHQHGGNEIHGGAEDDSPQRNDGKVNKAAVRDDEADVRRPEADAARGEPLCALGNEQNVAQPAGEDGGNDDAQRIRRNAAVPAQQSKQQPGLCYGAELFVAFKACVNVDDGVNDK